MDRMKFSNFNIGYHKDLAMLSHFTQSCFDHSQKTLRWAKSQISAQGKLTQYPDDLNCYYKLPYLLTVNGEQSLAHHVLNYMKAIFFQIDENVSFENKKTVNPLIAKFWGYVLGWVACAAQKLGRFDISYPAFEYLTKFQSQDHGGFATSGQ